MDRRDFSSAAATALTAALLTAPQALFAGPLDALSEKDAVQGVKTALEKGALAAIGVLGRQDGFLGNPKVRIPLPGFLEDASKILKTLGQGKRIEELVTAMNRAAEAAVPLARDLLVQAARSINVQDAARILTGGDTSVTAFFADKTRTSLFTQFLPLVTQVTEKVGLAERYNRVAGKASDLGLVKKEDANIQTYVANKSLDGLFLMIGEEEKKIRKDPVGTGSAILKKVFGAVK